jgi:formamidopyrimidine-DNA glycosylase
MPELPEVETTRLGISPWIVGKKIKKVIIRERRFRWKIQDDLEKKLEGKKIQSIKRRAKYLIFDTDYGSAIIHLGMSGSLRIIKDTEPPNKHDHVDFLFNNGMGLRLHDPRRFSSLLWTMDVSSHFLFLKLGVEPLSKDFTETYLNLKAKKRRIPIKQFIMNAHIVVGIGNIYASESLFQAGINPKTQTGRISKKRFSILVKSIKNILESAIKAGGTTLRNYYKTDGDPGYFKQYLYVYGRKGKPCHICKRKISSITIGQRSTFYCKNCQH